MSTTVESKQEWLIGTHLVTPRFGYQHHGIYIGSGKVLHYAGLCEWNHIGPVEEIDLIAFAAGHAIEVREHPKAKYYGHIAVARARSRLGERSYSLLKNNCEHFCTWCIDGISYSDQVAALLMMPVEFTTRLITWLRGVWPQRLRTA
ncbi:MAG: lecithin retinol acyltransferase family protein [Steroidobacteraceae bacterium]